ncbi:hypothetical protein DNTS_006033 [Danionella cerebrum]|uniref:SMB domain-containing protein n=1 Tax=Danionella cerebrum TaxID=2873325 RepID=A0A553Q055_9TELE|nr:hypothetical protein DNTS_006033 [Danionella translucida]
MLKLWTLASLSLLLLLSEGGMSGRTSSRTKRELAGPLHLRGIRDPFGSYCQRRGGCCPGRNDQCTVPYLDTICYCDLFCNRTISDCCPDFWSHCLRTTPPYPPKNSGILLKRPGQGARGMSDEWRSAGGMHVMYGEGGGEPVSAGGRIRAGSCERNGHRFPSGSTYKENCNLCTCGQNGRWDCEQHVCLIENDMIEEINRRGHGWRASNYSQFWGMTLDEGLRFRLGTKRPSRTIMNMNEIQMNMNGNDHLPGYFNAVDKWPGKIHEPLDQGNCNASWAFSTAAVASDRISIQSMGHMTPQLSPQNLISCDTRHQDGCAGGRIDGAWWYLRRRGVVTQECYPFSPPQQSSNEAVRCMMQSRAVGRGKRQATAHCPNSHSYHNDIYQSTPPYRLSTNLSWRSMRISLCTRVEFIDTLMSIITNRQSTASMPHIQSGSQAHRLSVFMEKIPPACIRLSPGPGKVCGELMDDQRDGKSIVEHRQTEYKYQLHPRGHGIPQTKAVK